MESQRLRKHTTHGNQEEEESTVPAQLDTDKPQSSLHVDLELVGS